MSGTEPHGGGAGGDGSAPQLPELPGITIEREIARGGMGVVYRGRQDFLDRRVAVKFLSMDLGGDDFAKRFQREAKILAGINHPNIVACHMADTTPEGQSYLVMEFIDGPNLKAWIEQNGALSPMAALRLVRSAGAALAHAHAVGIIHRDVKPENVLLEAVTSTAIDVSFPFTPKLVDLGLARMTQEQVGMDLTVPGSVMGTPSTMSPEQFDDPDSVDFRSDIYGLGCCLYQMLVGQAPFRGAKLTDIVLRKRAEVPPNPCDENPALPAMVGAYTQRLLASNRDDRPSSYKELDEELGMVMDAVSKGTADAPADDDQNQTVVSTPSAVPPPASAARSATIVGAGGQPAPAPRAPSTTTIVTPPADAAATQLTEKKASKAPMLAVAAAAVLAGGVYLATSAGGGEGPGNSSVGGGSGGRGAVGGGEPASRTSNRAPSVAPQPERATVDLGKTFQVALDASDPDGDELQYEWSFDRAVLNQRSDSGSATLSLELIDGLPGVVIPVTARVRDGNGGQVEVVREVVVGKCPTSNALQSAQAENAAWAQVGTWRNDLGAGMAFLGKQGRARAGKEATLTTRLPDDEYWEWTGTLAPTRGRRDKLGQGALELSYGVAGCAVRAEFDSESGDWELEVLDRVVGQSEYASRPDAERAKALRRWKMPAESDNEHRGWVSIQRRRDRLLVQIGQHVKTPTGEVSIGKSDPVEVVLTKAQQADLMEAGQIRLRVPAGICSFALTGR
ncbi:MAG: protein kinase [Planctomycetota bacterium]|nr:protein kinase [Planctomycetota bacterium]